MESLTIAILSLCGALAGFCVAYFVVNNVVLKKKKAQILKEAETEGENIKKEKIFQAKEKFLQLKSEHEQFINEKNNQIQQIENYATMGMDLIVVFPVNGEALTSVSQKVMNEGTPVFAFAMQIPDGAVTQMLSAEEADMGAACGNMANEWINANLEG